MSRSVFWGLAAVVAGATLAAQAPSPQSTSPKPLWTISSGFAQPESAYYHEPSHRIFVSNINGQVLEKDGNGYITMLAPSGRVLAEKWATGLNAPKGIRSIGNTLWTADIDEVVGMDVTQDGRISARVHVDGAQFLNDLATAPDGTIYVSDSNQSRVYMVKDGRSSVFIEGAELVEQPNGLLVDGDRLIVGSIGPAPAAGGGGRGRGGAATGGKLMAFDLKTKQRTLVTTEPVGGIDGIESADAGGFVVTDVIGRRLLHVYRTGAVMPLMTFDQGGADFGYIPVRVTRGTLGYGPVAVVPFLFGNSVAAYTLPGSVGR